MNGSDNSPRPHSVRTSEAGNEPQAAAKAGPALAEVPNYPYPNLPLGKTARQIRLLHLAPGTYSSPLRGRLDVVPLESAPQFEALSYVWGKTRLHMHIEINGKFDIPITDNLYAGLQRLRHHLRTRVMWVDAICINQCNLDERGHQVSFMGDIYATAARVCVWLGDVEGASRMKDHLRRIGSWLVRAEGVEYPAIQRGKSVDRAKLHIWRSLVSETLSSVLDTNQPAWHTRAWVYQEVIRAKKLVWCFQVFAVVASPGQVSNRIYGLYQNQMVYDFQAALYFDFSTTYIDRRTGAWMPSWPHLHLHEHLERTAKLQASDPRDKVYSLLNLLRASESRLIQPDYTKPYPQVFAEATFAIIVTTWSLQILGSAMYKNKISPKCLPSWTIDFEQGPRRLSAELPLWNVEDLTFSGFPNDGLPPARPVLSADCRLLHIDGVVLGIVDTIHSSKVVTCPEDNTHQPSSKTPRPYSAESSELGSQSRHPRLPGYESNQYRAINEVAMILDEEDDSDSFQSTLSWKWERLKRAKLAEALGPPKSGVTDDVDKERLWYLISQVASFWRFSRGLDYFYTKEGVQGFLADHVSPGDVLALVRGAVVPLILRPHNSGAYTFEGFAYVEGRLDGRLLQFWQTNKEHAQRLTLC